MSSSSCYQVRPPLPATKWCFYVLTTLTRLNHGLNALLLFQPDSRPAKDAASDYSEGASHVLAVIHDILAHHRSLESKWHAKKIKLHQRLALRLFQEDVKQVRQELSMVGFLPVGEVGTFGL